MLAADALEQRDPRPVASARPATQRARQALVNDVRETLVAHPERSLPELAHQVGVSPHHLSRTFHSLTGHTVSRHRMLLRAREALERIAQGDASMARVAADLGFADQSHLHRVVREQTGRSPSALRRALG
ncbi:MAG: helix-turn-helix transcriptional regulator [Solirubrobacteraceae bacterium]